MTTFKDILINVLLVVSIAFVAVIGYETGNLLHNLNKEIPKILENCTQTTDSIKKATDGVTLTSFLKAYADANAR